MFTRTKDPTQIELAIARAMRSLDNHEITSEEYEKILNHLFTLHKMKTEEKPSEVSPDTWAIIGANLLGIFLIIKHEHVNVITTKALGMIRNLR